MALRSLCGVYVISLSVLFADHSTETPRTGHYVACRSANSQDPTTDANGTRTLTSRLIKIEKQHSTGRTMQTSVKRVMLIRRSSSVSERYSRIYDQCSNPSDDDDEQDEELKMTSRSKKNMKKTGSILKACKRVFGF
ncbi:hypothetical protein R6Q59_020635 [Mikania micrantha]